MSHPRRPVSQVAVEGSDTRRAARLLPAALLAVLLLAAVLHADRKPAADDDPSLVLATEGSASPSSATGSVDEKNPRSRKPSPILAGASKVNITPFTMTDAHLACLADQSCPYRDILQLSSAEVSNPDGLPGGLFQTIGEEMAGPAASSNWIGPVGVWGEEFIDANGNGRYDAGEEFADDAANSSALVVEGHPSTLGDPASSTNKWDGTYIAGYGNNRVALGAFDPIWARVLFLRDQRTKTSIAWVFLDLTGYFSDFVGRIRARLPRGVDVDHIILTHTHDHEAPDVHVGIWGEDLLDDGTYPRYEIYIEAKIAEAIGEAYSNATPARFRFGSIGPGESFVTPNGNTESLVGMMSRNSCRTPWFFDDELRVMQVTTDPRGNKDPETIATLMNWGAHVESMDGRNRYLSSDLVHTARATLEQELGGIGLYAPSAQGAGEIVGDSCTRRWRRDTFDGETYTTDDSGDPVAFKDPYDNRMPRDRTYAIGRVVGSAALAALEGEEPDPAQAAFEFLGPKLLCFPVNNEGLLALAAAGVIDKPLASPECPAEESEAPDRAKSAFYAFRIGSGTFLTAPGEVAPELYYGISSTNRADVTSEYVEPNPDALACSARSHHGNEQPGAHTDRPYEPNITGGSAGPVWGQGQLPHRVHARLVGIRGAGLRLLLARGLGWIRLAGRTGGGSLPRPPARPCIPRSPIREPLPGDGFGRVDAGARGGLRAG